MVNRNDNGSPETATEERARALFDESVESLDGRTRSALTQARHAALSELDEHKQRPLRLWGPLGGVVAAALVVAVMFGPVWTTTRQAQQDTAAMPFEDLDIIADAENLELLENLEFYAWLDSVEALPSG